MIQPGETVHRAQVSWDADETDLRAHTFKLGGQTLQASCDVEFGGNADKANPEILFVASISSCHMLWFLSLARSERIPVASYHDDAEGTMDGVKFTRVVLRPRVALVGDVRDEQIDSLHHRAHQRCFIANSVACSVDVEPR